MVSWWYHDALLLFTHQQVVCKLYTYHSILIINKLGTVWAPVAMIFGSHTYHTSTCLSVSASCFLKTSCSVDITSLELAILSQWYIYSSRWLISHSHATSLTDPRADPWSQGTYWLEIISAHFKRLAYDLNRYTPCDKRSAYARLLVVPTIIILISPKPLFLFRYMYNFLWWE